MTQRHHTHAKVVSKFVRIPKPLEDGKVRCNGCGKVVRVSNVGRTYAHVTPAGEPCAYRVVYGDGSKLEELPEVNVPDPPVRDNWRSHGNEASRMDVGSNCEDCDKWLPGERRVCGRCQIQRDRDRIRRT